ncbi:Hypothetical predicted protein [Octopus vulgaris]|uniref:Uncharacterized protein n=1 Tax=Octopus vulgaris TaxID=6645 RepID=A0AA36AU85_OCTVU|nr:Hypothetical predicted protein [Octopus vulgaris]
MKAKEKHEKEREIGPPPTVVAEEKHESEKENETAPMAKTRTSIGGEEVNNGLETAEKREERENCSCESSSSLVDAQFSV